MAKIDEIRERLKKVAALGQAFLDEETDNVPEKNLGDEVSKVTVESVKERLDNLEEKPLALFGLSKETWAAIISIGALAIGALGGNIDRIWWSAEKGQALEVRIERLENAVFKSVAPEATNGAKPEVKTETPKVQYN
jgi:hypothetical protein